MRNFTWLMAFVLAACGGAAAGTPAANPDTSAQDASVADGAADSAGTSIAIDGDAGPPDTGAADTAQPTDAKADSGQDLAAVDTGPADTGPADAGPADTGPADTGLADTGPVDTGPTDAGPPDTSADVPPKESGYGGPCSAETACKLPSCIAPGQSPGCGICKQVEEGCTADSDCAKGGVKLVCKKVTCACGGESACQPGCESNAECATGQFCAPTGKCVALVCKKLGEDPSCPPNFVCQDAANPKCQRKACTASSACKGACVNGFCHDKAGTCMPPPP